MITLDEVLMNRHEQYPLDMAKVINLAMLMSSINYIRGAYGKPLLISSGYRPGHYNEQAGGAPKSAHLTCEAVDIVDSDGSFTKWCLDNLHEIRKAGMYMEDPEYTQGWVHLQIRKTTKTIFTPYARA